ncbi:MAG: hypothetical protein WAK78_08305, partial [Candidatus Acidiferrales bacterium]
NRSKSSDSNLAALASFLGANVRFSNSPTVEMFLACSENAAPPAAVALSADTLAALHREENLRESVREKLLSFRTIFLYGIAARTHDELLRWLSGDSMIATETSINAGQRELPVAGKRFSRQLSGASYPQPKSATTCDVFLPGTNSIVPIIAVSAKPMFLSLRVETCTLFVSTIAVIPNPDLRVMHEDDIEGHYDSLLPLLMFVRAACGDSCWHGGYRGSRLIIDDPVLRRRYGMLNFNALFESMRRYRYSATVAFIPWNHARTSRGAASFFNTAGEKFSVCVHGCDHTNNEYGSRDGDYLEQKSLLAMRRMQRQEVRTGLGFEPIMVFPQGRFSTASFRGLSSSGFLAAINSSRFPLDRDAAPVTLCELLLPAFNRICGFPVFLRHYLKSSFPFLLDLFLGRPAFIVEHHDFFQKGFPSLEALANRLNECEPDLRWGSLTETLQRTCWKRAVSSECWDVRFFTDTFCITNNSPLRLSYRLFKQEADMDSVTFLVLNGSNVPIGRRDQCIEIEMTLHPAQTARVQLHRRKPLLSTSRRAGFIYGGKVFVRRALSEFRDEFLVQHPAMLAQAKRTVRRLKATPDSVDSNKHNSRNLTAKR